MKLRCLMPTIIDGKRRGFAEIFEEHDPRLIDGLLSSGFAEPEIGARREIDRPPQWATQWRKT